MNNLEKALALRAAPLFASLSADALLPVAALCHQVDLVRNQVLFEAGEVGDALFVVVSGSVRVMRGNQLVARLDAGECVGEMGALDLEPRSATVAADEVTRLIRLERNDLMDLLTDYPELMRGLAEMLVERIRNVAS
ncbi:MAG TPA: cyclic nucleotide-binding domain-containing protein [Kofleriaceae bacterium]|nr:cyclic nucleotide-binding domain-containing protein [Kofleriaceae bacterium]